MILGRKIDDAICVDGVKGLRLRLICKYGHRFLKLEELLPDVEDLPSGGVGDRDLWR